MSTRKRPRGLTGNYRPDGPEVCTEFYVGFSRLEDGREHLAVFDGFPLIAGGGTMLESMYTQAELFACLSGTIIVIRRYTASEIVRTVEP